MDTTDPRVGSGRDNSTSPGLSRQVAGSNSSSLNSLLATLVPVLVWSALCIIIFVVLRRKCPRVYAPRALLKSLEPHERSAHLPNGWFNWIKEFYRVPSSFVLNHSSLDGFLMLRFLRVLSVICVVGIALLWPVLLPLHATGGAGNTELDRLTLGNVVSGKRLYAHALLAWVYFPFILYMISRECVYYINLRQAYLLSPYYANRLSSRTVLYMNVPRQYLDEDRLKWVLGKSVRRIWIPQKTPDLDRLIKEREQTALRLEKAEFTLIKTANAARRKALQKQQIEYERERYHASPRLGPISDTTSGITEQSSPNSKPANISEAIRSPASTLCETEKPLPDVNGSVASQWIPHSARPHHRPIANYGRRVDTIKWTRTQIGKLNSKIAQVRRQQLFKTRNLMPSVFVEFETNTDAQNAYQTLTHHRPLHMSQRYLGVRPFEILWDSLSMSWWESIIRKFLMMALITAMIIFWAIPSALVGSISNIEYLSEKVFFLKWVGDLPGAIKGVLSGVVPALALSLLMSIVPGILRYCAKLAGMPTLTRVELFTQHAYFAFQVVQVFLITTLTSAASAAVTKLLEDPTTAKDLLSQNLPKASNFYLSYFLLQSLAIGSTALLQFFNLFKFHVIQRFSNHPRKIHTRWHRLQRIHWGTVFPVYSNLGVITISYALIAPVILGFAAVGAAFLHVVYRYNLTYVYDSEIDTKGLVYPRALMHMLVGLYFAEVCMIGLFSLRGAFVPVVLTAALLVVTVLVHISLLDAVGPLLWSLPKSLTVEEDEHLLSKHPEQQHANAANDLEECGFPPGFDTSTDEHYTGDSRALEGADGAMNALGGGLKKWAKKKVKTDYPLLITTWNSFGSFWMRWISPNPAEKSNFFLRWLHPEVFSDYTVLRRMIPPDLPDPVYPKELEPDIYYPPSFIAKPPCLWIPRDPGGISRQEVEHTAKVIPATDEYVSIDKKGAITINLEATTPVFDTERLRY
ncbi:putative membrane protein C24H6.13 [Exophiala dermatitidis]